MKKMMFAGLLLSAFLVYLAVRDIRFEDVAEGFKTVRYRYIPLVLMLILLIQLLRSVRWGVILSPIEKVDQLSLFSVSSVGFLAIVTIPARLGELARPYLISKKCNIRMTAALGTIFVERVFDSLTILIMAAFVLFFIPLPLWLTEASLFFFFIIMTALAVMIFMIVKREKSFNALTAILKRLPDRYFQKLNRLLHHLIDGFKIIDNTRCLLYVIFLSGLIWLLGVLAIYILFFAFGFHLPPAAAFVLMIILIVGITIPTAPGFIGNWHYSCVLGLGLFNIPRTDALTFAVIYHFLSIGTLIILGLIFLPFNKFSFFGLNSQLSKDKNQENCGSNMPV
ncbi:MAG: lysylphosphatidylglycerol synthase transmembrane domain-containing protein [Syntrophales bacterium]|nr:lysylphosphatidylglycerol synthase transmembrane domain-containing protein [Syntrophales bacterium]